MNDGKRLLTQLRAGHKVPYAKVLPQITEDVPPVLRASLAMISQAHLSGISSLLSCLLAPSPTGPVPEPLLPYASGPLVQWAPEPSVRSFFARLFHHISANGNRSLCGWDLFHAHLFTDMRPGEADLCMLFHAAEFPKEFTLSSQCIHPLGSAASGGLRDPRIGTQLTLRSEDHARRNFLWLASTNSIYLLLPEEPSFPTDLLSPYAGYHFATVSEAAFCKQASSKSSI